MNNIVLLKPLMTEKSLKDKATYVFRVMTTATKKAIKDAIEDMYKGTEVGSVRTIVKKGKVKLVGRKRKKKQMAMVKKAYITLKKGEIPDIKVQ